MTYGLPDSAVYGTIKRADTYIRKSGYKHSPLFMEAQLAGWATVFGWIIKLGDMTRKTKRETYQAPKLYKFTPKDIKAKKVRFTIVKD